MDLLWDGQTARKPYKSSDMPEIHPIVREPDYWSFRQLIRRRDPQTARQMSADLAEICPDSKISRGWLKSVFMRTVSAWPLVSL